MYKCWKNKNYYNEWHNKIEMQKVHLNNTFKKTFYCILKVNTF